jgi:hypothetical protein
MPASVVVLPGGGAGYDPRVIEHDDEDEDSEPVPEPPPARPRAIEPARSPDPVWLADARPASNVTRGRFGK